MMLMLFAGLFIELLLVNTLQLWRYRLLPIIITIVTIAIWIGYSLPFVNNIFTCFLIITSVYRLLNLIKLSKSTIHPEYLKRVARRSSINLAIITIIIFAVDSVWAPIFNEGLLISISVVQLCVALMLLGVTVKNLQKTKHHPTKHYYSDKELPTVTVAIPARNETDDLASCIRTVLANDYPKLEVLVLDDCSQDRTAEVIRDFAHEGVRFIKGDPPQDRWLAKNQAYQKLAQEASGQIVLFCGVDVRLGPQAIRSLVSTMLIKKRKMMSVLPFRIGGGVNTSLVQPLRYWWELALPRRLFNRPPVLSTCWLIKRSTLKKLGNFKAVSHNILPEGYFAREAVKTDEYAFIRADEHLDVKTVKPVEEQLKTAIRVRYPSVRKRPENILLLTSFEIFFLLLPLGLAASIIWNGVTLYGSLALLASSMLVCVHYLIMSASHPFHSMLALFNYPFAILTEIILTINSMIRYEFGTVDWKGRNVCVPTMHVVRKLPKI